jgi:hypothetical protein
VCLHVFCGAVMSVNRVTCGSSCAFGPRGYPLGASFLWQLCRILPSHVCVRESTLHIRATCAMSKDTRCPCCKEVWLTLFFIGQLTFGQKSQREHLASTPAETFWGKWLTDGLVEQSTSVWEQTFQADAHHWSEHCSRHAAELLLSLFFQITGASIHEQKSTYFTLRRGGPSDVAIFHVSRLSTSISRLPDGRRGTVLANFIIFCSSLPAPWRCTWAKFLDKRESACVAGWAGLGVRSRHKPDSRGTRLHVQLPHRLSK